MFSDHGRKISLSGCFSSECSQRCATRRRLSKCSASKREKFSSRNQFGNAEMRPDISKHRNTVTSEIFSPSRVKITIASSSSSTMNRSGRGARYYPLTKLTLIQSHGSPRGTKRGSPQEDRRIGLTLDAVRGGR